MAVLPVGIGSEVGAGGYQIERSLRFNSADSAYLNRTPASAGNRKTWTWSGWVKRSTAGTQRLFYTRDASGDNQGGVYYSNDTLKYFARTSGTTRGEMNTVAVFRDFSAWYHILCVLDATNTSLKIYVNGVEQTLSVSTAIANVDQAINQTESHAIGREPTASDYMNGYMTEVNFIDGQALTPNSFGFFDNDGVWTPKQYTGPYGTNGFYLNFSDNSGTTATTLGKDYSGNGNNWTPNNFSVTAGAGNDSLVDSPTRYGTDTGAGGEVRGNYCTLNPLDKNTITLSNGNLQVTGSTTNQSVRSTIFVSSGKWYYEATITNVGTDAYVGFANNTYGFGGGSGRANWRGVDSGGVLNKLNATDTTGVGTFTTGDIIGCAIDFDADEIKWYKNNSLTVTYSSASLTSYAPLCPLIQGGGGSFEVNVNFGQRPFSYAAPTGFKALCTTNLPEPTIADGGEYFNTVLYTGNGTSQTVSGVGFSPDLVWVKGRSTALDHRLVDTARGVQLELISNSTAAENNNANGLTAFTSDGFTVGSAFGYNRSTEALVAWNWKANGSGVSNTDGSITSTVSANTDSGFSIVTYSGQSSNFSWGHGLGVKPDMVIIKGRTNTAGWGVYHSALGATKRLSLNTTDATETMGYFQNTEPTSSVFYVTTNGGTGASGVDYLAYCFAAVPGYSAFGSYTGNGSADGPFVYTGFRPAFVLQKRSDGGTVDWQIKDTTRDPYNAATKRLWPNLADAEGSGTDLDILSNGFKIRESGAATNTSGGTYIFAAFAENPFSTALAR